MNFYRCYFLSAATAIKDVAEFSCRGDDEALDHSKGLLAAKSHYHGFELWQGSRCVHRELADSSSK